MHGNAVAAKGILQRITDIRICRAAMARCPGGLTENGFLIEFVSIILPALIDHKSDVQPFCTVQMANPYRFFPVSLDLGGLVSVCKSGAFS